MLRRMSPNTCWLCKIFRAEENGISSSNTRTRYHSKKINIDSPARKAIRNIQEPTRFCFDEAQRILYMHMERDSYPCFLEAKFYQKLKHSLQTTGNNTMVN
ncbi:regulator of G-protein signaling 13-like [Pterocles gutturalis]